MQLVSSGIWTRVAVSISYDDNHYTTGTALYYLLRIITISHLKPYKLWQVVGVR